MAVSVKWEEGVTKLRQAIVHTSRTRWRRSDAGFHGAKLVDDDGPSCPNPGS